MRIRVDGALCSGHGRCYAVAPDVYAPDDEGYNAFRDTIVEIAPELEEQAQRGIANCPEAAISIIDGGNA